MRLNHPLDMDFFKNAVAVPCSQHRFRIRLTLHGWANSLPLPKGNYRTMNQLPFACVANTVMVDQFVRNAEGAW